MNLCISRQKTTQNYYVEFSETLYAALRKSIGVNLDEPTWHSNRVTVSHAEKFTFKPASLRADQRDYWLSRFVNDCLSLLTRYFEKQIFYLGPLRSSPSRSYIRSSHNLAVGVRGEHTPSVLANLERRLVKVTRGKSNISTSWNDFSTGVETVFPGYHVSSETHDELVKLHIASDGSKEYVSSSKSDVISDVGFGFSQVLPIILQASVMPEGATLLIEQPELHLHPLAQTRLAEFIANSASRKKRFVIETHSEHFVRGLQLAVSRSRVGNGSFSSDDVAFHYITKGSECSKELRINEFGEFTDEWPSGFFDESYKAIRQIMSNKVRAELC
jgi:predicted ATPase